MIDVDSLITISNDVDYTKYSKDNYFFVIDESVVDCSIVDGNDYEYNVQIIITHNVDFEENKIYISNELFDELFDYTNATITLKNEELNIDKKFNYEVAFGDYEYASIYINEKVLDELKNVPLVFCLKINNYDDIENAYDFIKQCNLKAEDYDNGLITLYKSILMIKVVMIVLSAVLMVYIVVMAFNMMKIYIDKKNKYLGLINGFGMEEKDIFKLYGLLLMSIIMTGIIVSLVISFVVIRIINNTSVKVFGTNLGFEINYYVPCILLAVFLASFFSFFYRNVMKKIKNNDLITLLRGGD